MPTKIPWQCKVGFHSWKRCYCKSCHKVRPKLHEWLPWRYKADEPSIQIRTCALCTSEEKKATDWQRTRYYDCELCEGACGKTVYVNPESCNHSDTPYGQEPYDVFVPCKSCDGAGKKVVRDFAGMMTTGSSEHVYHLCALLDDPLDDAPLLHYLVWLQEHHDRSLADRLRLSFKLLNELKSNTAKETAPHHATIPNEWQQIIETVRRKREARGKE